MQLTSGGSVCTPVFEAEDILSMHCDSRTMLINAANYCYHLIVKIFRLTRYLFQTNASFLTLMFRTVMWQHVYGVVEYFITTLLQIYH